LQQQQKKQAQTNYLFFQFSENRSQMKEQVLKGKKKPRKSGSVEDLGFEQELMTTRPKSPASNPRFSK
jgi:hypothetical protein